MNKKYFTPKKIHAYLRAAIQLVFFLFLPSAFTTAFSGIKSVLTQIGAGNPIAWSSFLTVLLALCAYTIVFGRFFCGYAGLNPFAVLFQRAARLSFQAGGL